MLLELSDVSTVREAEELARHLNDLVDAVSTVAEASPSTEQRAWA